MNFAVDAAENSAKGESVSELSSNSMLLDSSNLSVLKSPAELDLITKIEQILIPLTIGLRDVEIIGAGSSTVLRVTLDRLSPDTGTEIGIEDCVNVHHLLSPMLDVWDPLATAYTLEVSSPGEKPNLRLVSHFREALGKRIKFQSLVPIEMPAPMKPRKNWEGQLTHVNADTGTITLEDTMGIHTLKLSQIKQAVWLREWTAEPTEKKPTNAKEKKQL